MENWNDSAPMKIQIAAVLLILLVISIGVLLSSDGFSWRTVAFLLPTVIGAGLLALRIKVSKGWRSTASFLLVPTLAVALVFLGFWYWREGTVVTKAEFDTGIAQFTIEVRKVPVPVTQSDHFIVSLYRGQYVVTSFRFFWPNFTPEKVQISWPCINHFTVTFDDSYQASCEWSWGKGATWSINAKPNNPHGIHPPGLGEYFFTPRNPVPPNCPQPNIN